MKVTILPLLLFFLSCNRNYPCSNNVINPAFIGFSLSNIDTFVLRAYKPNDNFLHLVDTVLVCNCGATIYATTNDTTVVDVNSSNQNDYINPTFDWQIYIPSKNKIISISNIVSAHNEGSKNCGNPINSFIQDGQLIVKTNQDYTIGYMAYIHN